MITIYVMGKRYQVPEGSTILQALEYAGYQLVRGVGCRAGFCGACATVYNIKGDPQLKYALACQTVVEPEMYLVQIPFFPARKAIYDLEKTKPDPDEILNAYPDIVKCLGCNTCTKSCPQDLEVMEYMADAIRGDIAGVLKKSFDCLMCGLCAARCPQGLVPYNVALLCRRLYGRWLAQPSEHLKDRIEEVENGKFEGELEKLKQMSREELEQKYNEREIESL